LVFGGIERLFWQDIKLKTKLNNENPYSVNTTIDFLNFPEVLFGLRETPGKRLPAGIEQKRRQQLQKYSLNSCEAERSSKNKLPPKYLRF
jgi:hypothetical protein